MNTYQIVSSYNYDIVLAHVVAKTQDKAKELYLKKVLTLEEFEIIILRENVTDKHGNSLKEKITIF
jgi:hypothetical protein